MEDEDTQTNLQVFVSKGRACFELLSACFQFARPYLAYITFLMAVIVSTPILFIEFSSEYPLANDMASVAVLMSVLWIFESMPLAITALIPLILFPIYGIASANEVSAEYLNDSTFLFFGGFIVAKAIEKYDLHKRIALLLLSLAGNRTQLILLAFMVTTAFLSMWISNTATAALMIPILLSLLDTIRQTFVMKQIESTTRIDEESGEAIQIPADAPEPKLDPKLEHELKRYAICLLLGVAYSASLGGITTLIGTVPNLNFTRTLAIIYPQAPEVSFLTWMLFCLPISGCILIFMWLFFICFKSANAFFSKSRADFDLPADLFKQRYKELGRVSVEQIIILVAVFIMVLLWFTRLGFGTSWFSGWSQYLPDANYGTVAILIAVSMFIIPSPSSLCTKTILEWEDMLVFPWDIILLLGGGYALAFGFTSSGLSDWIATSFESFSNLNVVLVLFLVCFITTFLTELTSNTAVSSIFLPIVATLAVSIGENPLLLMVPCTISSSMAFMFPVATPPNAIAFASGILKIEDMAKPGFIFNLVAIVVVAVYTFLAGGIFFNIELGVVPSWAL